MSLFWRSTIFITSAVANFFAFQAIARYFGSADPTWMATLITVSVVVHECAHAIVMTIYGLKPLMFFALVIGGAMPTQIEKMKQLPWSRMAAITLAGPFANLVLVGVGALLYLGDIVTIRQFDQIASVNTQLFFLNLLPFSILDGGRFTKLLFDSVPEHLDLRFAPTLGVALVAIVFVTSIFTHRTTALTTMIFYFGLVHRAFRDDPVGSRNRQAIKPQEQIRWAVFYGAMLCVGGVLFNMIPDWME